MTANMFGLEIDTNEKPWFTLKGHIGNDPRNTLTLGGHLGQDLFHYGSSVFTTRNGGTQNHLTRDSNFTAYLFDLLMVFALFFISFH